jgi:hypothetical protein
MAIMSRKAELQLICTTINKCSSDSVGGFLGSGRIVAAEILFICDVHQYIISTASPSLIISDSCLVYIELCITEKFQL